MTFTFVVFVVVVVGSLVLVHYVDCLNILLTDVETLIDKALGMFGVFVRTSCLELILTQVCSLTSTFQISLHELNSQNQAVSNPGEVSMLLEVSGDAPLCHLVSLFV